MLHIFGGGTITHVRNHLALCAPAYGGTARALREHFVAAGLPVSAIRLELTRMASGSSRMETNDDVARRLEELLVQPETRVIVFSVALCDYEGQIGDVPSGKYAKRLSSREGSTTLTLRPADKLLARIKAVRPDVMVVGFKTTAGAHEHEQVLLAGRQIRETRADVVLANDTVTRKNILITGSQMVTVTTDRGAVLTALAGLIQERL